MVHGRAKPCVTARNLSHFILRFGIKMPTAVAQIMSAAAEIMSDGKNRGDLLRQFRDAGKARLMRSRIGSCHPRRPHQPIEFLARYEAELDCFLA